MTIHLKAPGQVLIAISDTAKDPTEQLMIHGAAHLYLATADDNGDVYQAGKVVVQLGPSSNVRALSIPQPAATAHPFHVENPSLCTVWISGEVNAGTGTLLVLAT